MRFELERCSLSAPATATCRRWLTAHDVRGGTEEPLGERAAADARATKHRSSKQTASPNDQVTIPAPGSRELGNEPVRQDCQLTGP